jgi:putative flippase GtrA
MKKIKQIYFKYEEIINYLIVGVLTTIVSLATYYLLVLTILNPNNAFELQIANIVSWLVAVTFAYYTNRKYVFKSNDPNIKKEMSSFYASRLATLLMDMGSMFIMVTLCHFNDKISKLIVQIIVTIANYVLSKLLVFKAKKQ